MHIDPLSGPSSIPSSVGEKNLDVREELTLTKTEFKGRSTMPLISKIIMTNDTGCITIPLVLKNQGRMCTVTKENQLKIRISSETDTRSSHLLFMIYLHLCLGIFIEMI